jgi:hypothetical protein
MVQGTHRSIGEKIGRPLCRQMLNNVRSSTNCYRVGGDHADADHECCGWCYQHQHRWLQKVKKMVALNQGM